ncbi:MAG: PLP-dependent aminotransferase family protein [Terriglobia bacterium]
MVNGDPRSLFINIDRSAHTPVYLQIDECIRNLVAQRMLHPGDRLPSTRQLARTLGLNRMTVEAAFAKLEADGLIDSQVGRGTFVNQTTEAPKAKPGPVSLDLKALSAMWGPLFVDLRPTSMFIPTPSSLRKTKAFSFVSAAPDAALFPAIEFRRCVDFVLKRRVNEIGNLREADGLPTLKEYLVRWFGREGIEATEDEVIITTGCQQSMDLIRKALIAPGDALMLENPTYPGAVAALTAPSVERLELPVQQQGLDADVLRSLGGRSLCKLVYVIPNFHNPTGRTMPLERRKQLISVCSQLRIPIVEDDVFGNLRYSGPALPALKARCRDLVIYIGSFSKMLNPCLRLGWIVAPRPAIRQLSSIKQASDLHTSLLMQAALDEFCRRDLLQRHLKRVRHVFAKRRDAMADALKRWFPADACWELPDGGLSMWVSLSPECNTENLLRLGQEQGVEFLPGSAFYFRSRIYNSLRLSFATETEQRIQDGIRALGNLLCSQKSRRFYVSKWPGPNTPAPIF